MRKYVKQHHLWYLSQEMLPLCLFSDHMAYDQKETVAKAILISPKSKMFTRISGTGFGKPEFQGLKGLCRIRQLEFF